VGGTACLADAAAGHARCPPRRLRQAAFKKLLLVEGLGKTAYYTLGAVVGGFFFTGLTNVLGRFSASAVMVAGSVAFCVLVTWRRSRDAIFGWAERLIP